MTIGKLRSWFFTIPLEWAVTAVMITIAVVTSVVAPAGRWQRFLYRLWARMVLGIAGARVRVHHAERLDPNANYVVAANHLSLLDTPLMLWSLPLEFKFLAKRELLKTPFIGWYLKRGGHLTVDRKSLRSSLESMNESARLIRERKLSVLIFPEGTRGLGELQPFKDGAAYLAIQSGVAAVPVAIHGTEDVLAAKHSEFRSADVDVMIGEPIPVDGMTLKDRGRLTADLHARVSQMLAGSKARRAIQ
ncbi:MAG: 1-acyl-sn-glycerol-3-phosphate acyltransferase [Bryobacteraceae bacterium]|nr:1-acyl-sn-glycerol-3-phosphate acyltransferase [Bryobacteraceae bacterium]